MFLLTGVLFIGALMISCESELMDMEAALGSNAGIIGTWIEEGYTGDTLNLYRAGNLVADHYGFTIEGDGTFVERKNSAFLADASVTYDNYEGTWEAVSDSLLNITVDYWGGVMTYQIRIVSVDAEKLAIRYLYTENRADSRKHQF